MTDTTPLTARRIDSGLAVLRIIVGIIFMVHGGQKLFVFGFAGVSGAFAQMGIPLPGVTGPLVGLMEFSGGFALVVGLLTRLSALGLGITMLGAIVMVHAAAGFFLPTGYEFALALLGATITLALTGAGSYSIDGIIARRRNVPNATA